MKYNVFEDWMLEDEGAGPRCERFYDIFTSNQSELAIQAKLIHWLKTAFDAARMPEEVPVFAEEVVRDLAWKLYQESNCSFMDCVNTIIKYKCNYEDAREFLLTRFRT